MRKSGRISLDFRWRYGLGILKQSYPFALLVLLMSFFNRIDSVMLERMLSNGKTEAGIYAQSFRILDATSMFALLFAGLLLPIFSRMLKQQEKTGEMVKLSFSLLIIPALTLVVISLFYNKNIISLLYLEHIDYSSAIYKILIVSLVFSSTSYIFGTLLTANGSLYHLNMLAGITLVLNVSLNLILIPRYEAKGAAIANLCSQGFYALSQAITAQKLLGLKMNLAFMFRLLIFIVILAILTWLTSMYIHSWGAGFFIICILAVILMWLLGINTPKSIYYIIKNNS
jgi:O-antigen/teichoic acid export membrane protein